MKEIELKGGKEKENKKDKKKLILVSDAAVVGK